MTDYRALWAQKNTQASIASTIKDTQRVLAKFGSWFEKYRGGMPLHWMSLICAWESGGTPNLVGDPSLGEYGLFQVAANVPTQFGLPPEARMDPESNIAIASLEYACEAVRWKIRYPNLIELDSDDIWKLARLSFAIGRGGSYGLASRANVSSVGDVYGDIRRWVAENGGVPLGSQSADQVWFRVLSIDLQWNIAGAAAGHRLVSGPPTLIPAPPAGPYTIPNNFLPFFSQGASPFWFFATGLGVMALLVYLSKRGK